MDVLTAVFRWLHILAGVIWIGMLYFFNWVNGPFAKTLDAATKKQVVPELMPRALFWFRWGAAWTWLTGFLLLMLVFYHGGIMFEDGSWTAAAGVMVALTFGATFAYDALHKALGKDARVFSIVAFVATAVMLVLMVEVGGFSYRAFNIHLGAMFGSMMAFNVWYRIWPAQQKILAAVKQGEAPDADLVDLATVRSRHNTYMSLPLFWTMVNQHHVTVATSLGIPGEYAFTLLLGVIALGWHIVWQLYRRSAKVPGL